MVTGRIVEHIDADLEELIPRFMENTRKELTAMKKALQDQDFVTLKRLGHSAKGAALGYGFEGMGAIGLDLETAAESKNTKLADSLIQKFEDYLARVEVVYQ